MKYCLLLLFFFTAWLPSAMARTGAGSVSGRVVDAWQKPVAGANAVLLQAADKKLVKADVTNATGGFTMDDLADGKYLLQINQQGFDAFVSDTIIVTGTAVSLNDITLQQKSAALKDVVVRAQKPFVEVMADKLVVNVENSIVSAGSSAMDVLTRSPGVRVDQNDNISLKGKPGVIIMIDGKITPLSGTDLANVLKSMPAASIDKIELISNPGARYDAAGSAGIINIKTKEDQRMGMNGSVNLSYAQGVYPKYNGGFSLNYHNRKWNVYGSYSYAYRYWFNHLMLNRRFLDTSAGHKDRQLFAYRQDNNALFDFRNHIASAGADYSWSKKTTIGIAVSAITNAFDPKADNASVALGPQDELLYHFNTSGRHHNNYYNYTANLNMRHSFDSTGRELSVDLDYAAFGNHSKQNFVTTYTDANGGMYQPDYYLKSNLEGLTQVRSLKADYTQPLKKQAKFDAGIKTSYVTADNEPLFYEKLNGEYELDTRRSNHFLYNENINAAYVNYSREWQRWGMQLGLRAEQTNAQWEQRTTSQEYSTSYMQLFPSVALQRHINTSNDLGLTLSRRIERPGYQQLNPFKYFIDKTTYREGYPYLKPALSYSAELSHTFRQKFITTFTYSVVKNVISEVIQPSESEDSVTVQTNKNLRQMIFIGVSGAYPVQITKWWSNVTNFNVYYSRYEGYLANTNLNSGRTTFDINTNNSFVLPKDFSAEVGLFYQARQQYNFMDVKPNWMLNAGIQKNLPDRRATIKLAVQDIFWKGYPSATSTYTGYQEDFVAERETRQASITFIYRFGKKTVAPIRRRSSGAEEEKKRAGNGGA